MLTSFFKKHGFIVGNLLVLHVAVCILTGCSMYTNVTSPIIPIQSGSSVPFNRVMNIAFAKQYIGADIITNVEFLSGSYSAEGMKGDVPEGFFAFRVSAPGESPPPSNEMSSTVANIVVAPNRYADLVFSLKPRDLIELSGGTIVKKLSPFVQISSFNMVGDQSYVIFKAYDLKRVIKE